MVRGIEPHLAGGREAVFLLIQVLDAAVHRPALVTGVEYTHDTVHGNGGAQLEMQVLLKILPILAVQRGHHRQLMQLAKRQTGHPHGKRRMDMHQVDAAPDKPGIKHRVQRRQRNRIVVGKERKAGALLHLIRQCFLYLPRIRAKNHHIAIVCQPAGIIIHNLYDTVHHRIPGVNE